MIDGLAELLEAFPGPANRTRCFAHILNLVAKSILRQFDVPKAKSDEALDVAAQALAELAEDLDHEGDDDEVGDKDEDDDVEGMVDVRAEMTEEEIEALDASLQPVRVVLVKVCIFQLRMGLEINTTIQIRKLAFAIKNSPMLILPEWTAILRRLEVASKRDGKKPLTIRMVPRDVPTRWNSTFDMLHFAVKYHVALDEITAHRDMKLRRFELSEEEWNIAEQLANVLKVSYPVFLSVSHSLLFVQRSSKTRHHTSRERRPTSQL